MVRSMYYKMVKYYNASDLDEIKRLNSGIRKLKKDVENYKDRAVKAENLIYSYENYKAYNDEIDDFDFKRLLKQKRKVFGEYKSKEREVHMNNLKEKLVKVE